MKSTFGKNITVEIFGGSHEEIIGVTIKNFPISLPEIDMAKLQAFLDKRAPGNSPFATARKEPDKAELHSEDPLTFIIKNIDAKPSDYKTMSAIPRPGHADYTAFVRYGKSVNMAGGGPFSARMTAPLCIAGGIALQYLEKRGIRIGAHILSVDDICEKSFDPFNPQIDEIQSEFPVINRVVGDLMRERILNVAKEKDSLGGVVEVAAVGLPPGIGGAMYDGLESLLAPIFFGIPAVKGVEFGNGFESSKMKGSENNDAFEIKDGKVVTKTNNAGGILGGITTGMPILLKIAFKPTPSIPKEQDSVNLDKMENCKLKIKGRHDPCVAFRAIPVTMAATALGILDSLVGQETQD